ncbi:Hypothetical protein SCF082_LOCUS2569 [Durusdinium trenchii]|uniref:Uncharacterized protein n=1 Tax=Durusdinium trenchii TaxID=1381693 RepID=A0ABP0HLY2_9DINO
MQESWETVLVCQGKASADGDEEVNGWITLGFALGGVAFDVMRLSAASSTLITSNSLSLVTEGWVDTPQGILIRMRLHDDHDPEVPIDAKLYGGPCRSSPRAEGAKLAFQRSGEMRS